MSSLIAAVKEQALLVRSVEQSIVSMLDFLRACVELSSASRLFCLDKSAGRVSSNTNASYRLVDRLVGA